MSYWYDSIIIKFHEFSSKGFAAFECHAMGVFISECHTLSNSLLRYLLFALGTCVACRPNLCNS